ncbi:MAG: LemA family protein [Candidatus Babeliaceae bacterium]|nr:LemA family protein [Candidatus Babeliaceae bacterium]
MSWFLIISIVALAVILWGIAAYNRLVQLKALSDEGWSGIDVQLKRRYDLVPNLVAVVKQYSIHEKEVLEKVTQYRSMAINATTVADKATAEVGLSQTLKTLFAVAESYPDLKANINFLELQKDLGSLEHELQLARRYYNGAARNYNIATRTFPASLIAHLTGFIPVPYFEVDNAAERQNPQVRF